MGHGMRRLTPALTVWLLAAPAVATVTVDAFSPQGTVRQVRQVTARFSDPMVPFGDLRDVPAPFVIDCAAAGTAHWVDSRTWVFDFTRDLPAGVRCAFTLRDGLRSLADELVSGPQRFEFSTGGPMIVSSQPAAEGDRIEEEQTFILSLSGEPTEESVIAHAGFDIEGIAERVGVELITGAARDQFIRALPAWLRPEGAAVVLKARQAFPAKAKVRFVWGAGIASPSGIATLHDQVLTFRVRTPFTAKLSCERENAKADCIPLTPIEVRFSAPVAWAQASQVQLIGPGDATFHVRPPEEPADFVERVAFAGPFPEAAAFHVVIPPDLRDDAGRALAPRNVSTLTTKTAPFPPLAKFAARFGILESQADPALPVTIRNLDPEVHGQELLVTKARTTGWRAELQSLYARLAGNIMRVPPERPEQILPWLRRLAAARRTTSIFADAAVPEGHALQGFTLPQPDGPQTLQVVGIPLPAPGLYVVELASPRLGADLLGSDQPMYVPAAALVTNLAVHFKWARETSLAWVTTLDDAKPVGGAHIVVQDCHGTVIANAETDDDGIARLNGLPDDAHAPRCGNDEAFKDFDDLDYREYYAAPALNGLEGGLLITAQTSSDMSFVHSSWIEGIEPWRFQLPPASGETPVVAHTILDRALFRTGDTVHMKHVLRRETMGGFDLVAPDELPKRTVIRHLGSNQTYELPLTWDASGVAEQTWQIPAGAKLGQYDITFEMGEYRTWRSGSFRIEQFRVPLMKASVQLPAAPQVGATAVPVDIAVQYLAGGAAANLPVVVRAQVRDREPPKRADFEHATFANGPVQEGLVRESESEESQPAAAHTTAALQRQTVTLDAAGTAYTQIAGVPPVTTVRELLAEVAYRDPNGETQTTAATVPLWPAALLPGIEVENWAATKRSIRTTVVVVDTSGAPVAGAPVQVDAFEREIYSHRKRLVGGFYAYEHVEDTERLRPFCSGTTDAQGVLQCTGVPPRTGELVLQATVTDPAGHTAAAHESVFVPGREEQGFRVEASDRIDVIPEKREYEPGETARFQVRMPFKRATALVTVEREGVGPAEVLTLSAKNPVIEVPIRGEYAPNAFVSVFLVRGRIDDVQPRAMVDLGKPAFKLGIAEIRVGWRAHTLSVEVAADRAAYQVRDTATVQIAVRTADGAPPPPGSDVAVAAVDEGLLELMPNRSWDLLQAMMGRRGYGVRTATAQMEVIGKRHFGRKALPHGGGGGRQTTRDLFDTLLLWRGRVPLDADGHATVRVPLNDSLTSFRIAAVATGGLGEFGTGFTEIHSTQDLMLLSGIPPLVREGDALPAQFTLRNTTARALQVEATGHVDGLAAPLSSQAVALAPGEARVVQWPIRVPSGADVLRYTIDATAADGPSDRLSVAQQVEPAVPVRTLQAALAQWEPGWHMPVQRPADALPDRGGLDVTAAASLAGGLEPMQQWLRAYPYSCLEQQTSIAVGLGDPARWNALVAALPAYTDADGLLKYFPSMTEGSDVLTAYVVAVSQAAGLAVPTPVQEKLVGGLRAFVDGSIRRESRLNAPDLALRKLAAIDALARVEAAEPPLLDSIALDPNSWPTSAVLDWWDILERVPAIPDREGRLRTAEQIVRARLNLQGTAMGFSTESGDSLYWLMTDADVNALKLITLVSEFNQWHGEVPQLMRGALARQQRGRWTTTTADAWGAVAMRRFTHAFESAPVTGTTAISLADATQQITWTAAPEAGSPSVATPSLLHLPWPAQPGELGADHHGGGAPWLTVASRAAIPLGAPLSSGYQVTKAVTPVDARTPGKLSVGDTLRVRLDIDAQSDMTWVVVNDPIPAGASHLGTGLARDSQIDTADNTEHLDAAFVERRFDAYRGYYDFVPKGHLTAEYVIRLNQSGHFEMPPTRVEALYAPEMFGELPNAAVEVEP